MAFGVDDNRPGLKWFFRALSVAAIVAVLVGIGFFMRRGQSFPAGMLVVLVVPVAILFSWSWTGSVLGSIARAKGYVEGVEGDGRHEWFAFRGQRVRVFLDEEQQPWFALNEIAFILSLHVDEQTFRHYRSSELAIPESASEKCLSESGLRRLIKYSTHPDARPLGLWLDREVLRVLKNRSERA